MEQLHTHFVVMAGGIGQRLWPWSSQSSPKQFQDFFGVGNSLLQMTVNRFKSLVDKNRIWIITQSAYKALVQQQLPWLDEQQILCEPIAKNTAICIAHACQVISAQDPNAHLVVMPADHYIANETLFQDSVQQALDHTQQTDELALLGVPCVKPDTGYGYMAYEPYRGAVKRVVAFKEKPAFEQALAYIRAGNYVWNTGIFVGRLATFIKSYQSHLPRVWEMLTAHRTYVKSEQALLEVYQQLPAISFDQAILEKSKDLAVVCQDFGWSDLGTWESLYEQLPKNEQDNFIQGQVVAIDTAGCLIKGNEKQLIAVNGVKDLVIVQQENSILISTKTALKAMQALIKKIAEKSG